MENNRLKTKFKDRTPEETVQLLKNFFSTLGDGFRLEETIQKKTSADTFWEHVKLLYNGIVIQSANGKGTSEEFCKASALAELYERICNGMFITADIANSWDGDKTISLEESISHYNKFHSDEIWEGLIRQGKGLYGKCSRKMEFQSIYDEEEKIFLNQHLHLDLYGSTGMAAGNTIEEGLNQGISELMERYVIGEGYYSEIELKHIPDELIKKECPAIYPSVELLESKGFIVNFFDASEATGLPVIASHIVNKAKGYFRINFGAFPVFEIAIERSITEALQGKVVERPESFLKTSVTKEINDFQLLKMWEDGNAYYPEELFLPNESMKSINKDVFINNTCSNIEILEHVKKLLHKKKMHVYYMDNSVLKNMAAVWIFSPELQHRTPVWIYSIEERDYNKVNSLVDRLKQNDMTMTEKYELLRFLNSMTGPASSYFCGKLSKHSVRAFYDDYICAILYYNLYEYGQALEIFRMLPDEFYQQEPSINTLRLVLEYKAQGCSDEEMIHKMRVWGYNKEELDMFTTNGNEFTKMYLSDFLWGEVPEKRISTLNEVWNIVDTRRKSEMEAV